MSTPSPDLLRQRITETRKLLDVQLQQNKEAAVVEKTVNYLGVLEDLARGHRRRRSAFWAVGAVVVVLIAVTLLRFSALDRVDMALVAETRAFVFRNGQESVNVLPVGALLREVTAEGQALALCTDPRKLRPFPCKPEAAVRLNRLEVYRDATVAVRQTGSCFEVAVLEGGAKADVTALAPGGQGRWRFETLKMGPGESFGFCPTEGATLHGRGIAWMMVGDRTGIGLAEQEDAPALSQASLSLPSVAKSERFLGTEILRFGGLENGVAVARLGSSIDLSLVAKARRLSVQTGLHGRSLMPSQLDRILEAPKLKAALAFLTALLGTLVAVRERWLGEVGRSSAD